MGYGLIQDLGNSMRLLSMGVIKLEKMSDSYARLQRIFDRTLYLIDEYKPDELAIEAPFYGKNVQSMLKLGRAQGVAIAAALHRSVPIFEYSPRKIKQSITGKGGASKEQVASMLRVMLSIDEAPQYLDATDGLAAAVCHYFQKNTIPSKQRYKDWKSYLSQNPDKISS